jgi:macrodomain Ter protein organizer (MatP/YcbG family)
LRAVLCCFVAFLRKKSYNVYIKTERRMAMMEKQPKQRVSVSLSVDVYQKLVTLAAETGLSKSGLITVLINGAAGGKNDKK